jgi:hypothetical protein
LGFEAYLVKQWRERKMKFEGVEVIIQEGDIISSKKGLLQISPVTKNKYLVFKQEYLGKGCWKVLGEKAKIN